MAALNGLNGALVLEKSEMRTLKQGVDGDEVSGLVWISLKLALPNRARCLVSRAKCGSGSLVPPNLQ